MDKDVESKVQKVLSAQAWPIRRVADLGTDSEQAVLTGPFGSKLSTDMFTDSGVPVLTIGCLQEGGLELDKANFISESTATEFERYRLCQGDVLFSRMASVGRAAVVPHWLEGAIFNYHLMRLRLDARKILPAFFMYQVKGSPMVAEYIDEVTHGATRDGINTTELLEMPVAAPAIQVQRRVTATLDTLTSHARHANDYLTSIPPLIDKFRQSVLARAFTGELTADWRAQHPDVEPASELLERIRVERRQKYIDDYGEKWRLKEKKKAEETGKEWTPEKAEKVVSKAKKRAAKRYKPLEAADTAELPDLPPSWCWATVEELSACEDYSTTDGPFGSKLKTAHYVDEAEAAAQVVTLTNLGVGKFDNSTRRFIDDARYQMLEKHWIYPGDLLIAALADPVGRCCEVPADLGPAVVKADCYRYKVHKSINRPYLMHNFNSPQGHARFEEISRGVGRERINLTNTRLLPVPLPPREEQDEVVRIVRRYLQRSDRLLDQMGETEEILDVLQISMLNDSFSGLTG